MICLVENIGDEWVCPDCGFRHRGKRPLRDCPASPTLQPAADELGVSLADAAHYTAALARWTAAGWPTRTEAEVARIFLICQVCEALRGDRCGECRCRVAVSGMAVANKIKMATEKCALGKW